MLGRLRHPTLDLHMILSTNPVSESNWSFKHFFKDAKSKLLVLDDQELYKRRTMVVGNTYYHHSTADDNLFLPESYVEQLDELKGFDPDLYRIARKGQFGVTGIRVLPQFVTKPHEEVMKEIATIRRPLRRTGMDFGFTTSYNALVRMVVDREKQILYIFEEYYKNRQTDDVTVQELQHLKRENITADHAEPKTIAYFKKSGFRMEGAKKGAGSRLQSTKKVKRFKQIICSDACPNTIYELEDLTFKVDKHDEVVEDDFSIDPHTLSAIWYGLDDYEVADIKGSSLTSRKNAW